MKKPSSPPPRAQRREHLSYPGATPSSSSTALPSAALPSVFSPCDSQYHTPSFPSRYSSQHPNGVRMNYEMNFADNRERPSLGHSPSAPDMGEPSIASPGGTSHFRFKPFIPLPAPENDHSLPPSPSCHSLGALSPYCQQLPDSPRWLAANAVQSNADMPNGHPRHGNSTCGQPTDGHLSNCRSRLTSPLVIQTGADPRIGVSMNHFGHQLNGHAPNGYAINGHVEENCHRDSQLDLSPSGWGRPRGISPCTRVQLTDMLQPVFFTNCRSGVEPCQVRGSSPPPKANRSGMNHCLHEYAQLESQIDHGSSILVHAQSWVNERHQQSFSRLPVTQMQDCSTLSASYQYSSNCYSAGFNRLGADRSLVESPCRTAEITEIRFSTPTRSSTEPVTSSTPCTSIHVSDYSTIRERAHDSNSRSISTMVGSSLDSVEAPTESVKRKASESGTTSTELVRPAPVLSNAIEFPTDALPSLNPSTPMMHRGSSTQVSGKSSRRLSAPNSPFQRERSASQRSTDFVIRRGSSRRLSDEIDEEDGVDDHVQHSSDSDHEMLEEPEPDGFNPHKRRVAFSQEAHGAFNPFKVAFSPPSCRQTKAEFEMLKKSLTNCPLFACQHIDTIECIASAMEIEVKEADTYILRQGEFGRSGYVLIDGVLDVYDDSKKSPQAPKGACIRSLSPGCFFGEMTMLYGVPRTKSIVAQTDCKMAKLKRDAYTGFVTRREMKERTQREDCLRNVKMFETLNEEQVAALGDALEKRVYKQNEPIIKQGEAGTEFFVVAKGECVVEVTTGSDEGNLDVQEYMHYHEGDLFGELALLKNTKRSATVRALTTVEVLCLRRSKFERMLGPLDQLQKMNYLNDPRKCIADFFRKGDQRGPHGMIQFPSQSFEGEVCSKNGGETTWFAVYRPTSRDAIAKMLSSVAVGKGLNVKGKSAKKNRLSGFVPFMQIHKNEHKVDIEESPVEARVTIFFTTVQARKTVLIELENVLSEDIHKNIPERSISMVDRYTKVWGLEMPELIMREAYITRQDISEIVGWETGRKSEPAFMDMNLHAIRGDSSPTVVLYQNDQENLMNPHGLLIAYAEEDRVKPVVSDFDTFTVGSRNMPYEKLIPEQQQLAMWSLQHTLEILETPNASSWSTRWLDVLREANEQGFHPVLPKYGFGDATSVLLTEGVCRSTIESGAVRHGAECFNFHFPQELDDNFLVVWDCFPDKPWEYMSEPELREFLLERITEGYAFPLNPVWAVRDEGWYEVFRELRNSEEARGPISSWYPTESGLLNKIDEIHNDFPDGFSVQMGGSGRRSFVGDLSACERADLVQYKASPKAMEHAANFVNALIQSNSLKTRVIDGQDELITPRTKGFRALRSIWDKDGLASLRERGQV